MPVDHRNRALQIRIRIKQLLDVRRILLNQTFKRNEHTLPAVRNFVINGEVASEKQIGYFTARKCKILLFVIAVRRRCIEFKCNIR
ncbi:hypothetical protein D3C73_720980 [compost metagenome]